MSYRGINRIVLYNNGLVMCLDAEGRQAPPLQGLYQDVIDKITRHFGPQDVTWIYGDNHQEILFTEWCEFGKKTIDAAIKIESKPVNENILNQIRISQSDQFEGDDEHKQ